MKKELDASWNNLRVSKWYIGKKKCKKYILTDHTDSQLLK